MALAYWESFPYTWHIWVIVEAEGVITARNTISSNFFPSKCSEEDINRDAALLLTKMEAKAAANAFKTRLEWNGELVDERPANLDFTREPYCHVPAAFR